MLEKINSYFEKSTQNIQRICVILFLSAFLVRLVYVLTLDDKWYFYDTVHYDKAANSILNGEGFGRGYFFSSIKEFQDEYSLPPVYPVFLAGVYAIFGQDFFAVRIVQSLVCAFLTLMIFLIAERVFNRRVALLAAVISIFYPLLVFISGLLYVTALFTLLIALFVWFALKSYESEDIKSPALAGLFLGLATLAGPILLGFYPLAALWMVFTLDKPFFSRVKTTAIFLTIAVLTLVPWGIRNYKIFGKVTPVSASADWFLSEAQSRIQNELNVRISTDDSGIHFEVYVSGDFDGRLTAPSKPIEKPREYYAGLMLKGGLSKYIDRFEIKRNLDNSRLHEVDEFEHEGLNNMWLADSVFGTVRGHLANFSSDVEKDFLAVFVGLPNPTEVTLKWGKDTEAAGVSQTGVALLLDRPSLDASGYVLKRLPYGMLELWQVESGSPMKLIAEKMGEKSLGIGTNGAQPGVSRGGIFGKIFYILTDDPKGFISHYSSEFVHFWQLYPDRVMTKNQFTNSKTMYVSIATFAPVLIFSILALFYSKKNWRKVGLLFLTIMSFALGYAFFQTRVRYRIPVEPYMIILASYGFAIVFERVKLALQRR